MSNESVVSLSWGTLLAIVWRDWEKLCKPQVTKLHSQLATPPIHRSGVILLEPTNTRNESQNSSCGLLYNARHCLCLGLHAVDYRMHGEWRIMKDLVECSRGLFDAISRYSYGRPEETHEEIIDTLAGIAAEIWIGPLLNPCLLGVTAAPTFVTTKYVSL
jgi:hypothetical protein